MPSFVELCAVRLPGREARISETAYSNYRDLIQEMADALLEDCDIPYAIFGHSMGAVLAYEFAHELKRRGAPEPVGMFLSGRVAAHLELAAKPLHELPLEDFIREIGLRYGELPQEVLADREMLEFYLPILRADLRLIETYRYEVKPSLRCPILVAGGLEDQSIWSEGLEAWKEHTTGSFDVLRYEGGHFYLAGPAKEHLLQMLRNKLISLDSGLHT
jgi:surfactin synthase thioesterase subunit